ncbi:unnamed protein product [Haemonchus placei]|uniref:CUB domain-containing protein n=1 Tax=Haemonchus placei TaxID=6290 RepID=A0A0N4WAN5_HAEPC|nr:unnamed protein product [Haemonchus placei]
MTNYPNDQHVCSFLMSAKGQTNVQFYAGRRAVANKELSVNLRHVLTRNDTRPLVSGWRITNVTSKIGYYDYGNITDKKLAPYSFTVAIQSVHFRRHDPSYFYTLNVPALVFVAFNIAGIDLFRLFQSVCLEISCRSACHGLSTGDGLLPHRLVLARPLYPRFYRQTSSLL